MSREITRTCCVCKTKQEKGSMNRVVLENGSLILDNNKKLFGKGCYVCKNDNCINELIKKRNFNRFFKCNIQDSEYTKICEELKSCK